MAISDWVQNIFIVFHISFVLHILIVHCILQICNHRLSAFAEIYFQAYVVIDCIVKSVRSDLIVFVVVRGVGLGVQILCTLNLLLHMCSHFRAIVTVQALCGASIFVWIILKLNLNDENKFRIFCNVHIYYDIVHEPEKYDIYCA